MKTTVIFTDTLTDDQVPVKTLICKLHQIKEISSWLT